MLDLSLFSLVYDSACVTKTQVATVEKMIEQYADVIRKENAELIKIDNPTQFAIKNLLNNTFLMKIPRELNE